MKIKRNRSLTTRMSANADQPTRLSEMNRSRRRSRSNMGRAGFDASADNRFNSNHFADASTSDITSIIMGDRSAMVKRCRYEYRNNAYARAMVMSWANEIVGTGPKLQMQTDNSKLNTMIENLWNEWAKHCDASEKQNLAGMLRTSLGALPQFGEAFTTFKSVRNGSRSAARHAVTLRLLEINPQRVGTPYLGKVEDDEFDGMKIDKDSGAVLNYTVYDSLPSNFRMMTLSTSDVPADDMVHIYLTDEPGQYRGFPMMAPVLTLMGDLRRYTKAVVAAAEQAANISGVIYSTLTQTAQVAKAMDEIQIARNTLLTLPAGYEAKAFNPSQPTNTYGEFKNEIIGEIGRAFMMPFIVASGNAKGYNYSSGRLDLQDWWKSVGIVQEYVGERKLDPIFARFMQELIVLNNTMPGYLPNYSQKIKDMGIWNLPHQWVWPGHEHVDPAKEAKAQEIRLKNNTTTLAHEFGKQGKDWERELEQQKREQDKLKELGLSLTAEDDTTTDKTTDTKPPESRSDDGLYDVNGRIYEMVDGKLKEVIDAN